MEKLEIREQYSRALNIIVEKFKTDIKCLAGFLIGSMSHDMIWEWSDLQILLIYDDSYKGSSSYYLIENDVPIVINVRKKNNFKNYLESTNVSDYFFCALSKSTLLFTKDKILKEYFEDILYIGDREREIEMLLGFSEAIYYMNKAEKNIKVKNNSANAIYFIFHIAQGIAWLEVARARLFPEREIISQASKINPILFNKIYDVLYSEKVTNHIIEEIIETCHEYLKENTMEVYRPIISYLIEHGTLKEFSLKTREHGFGINYDWLYRMGIVDIYVEPVRINNNAEEFFQIGYKIKKEYC
ncbi:MAG: hypothetical protein MJB12_14830 [Firmicutes bacterium]|nr:hypothetical protein [Bacillota bacterium]